MAEVLCFEEYQRLKVVTHMPDGFMPEKPMAHLERQGTLDGLCGVYCVVNAVSHVALLTPSSREVLFKRLVRVLNSQKRFANYLLNGTDDKQFKRLLKEARRWLKKEQGLELVITPLFSPSSRVKMENYLKRIQQFIRTDIGVVIVGLDGVHLHWTCISDITPKTIKLIDSGELDHLRISHCRLSKKSLPNLHCMHPSETWGIRLGL